MRVEEVRRRLSKPAPIRCCNWGMTEDAPCQASTDRHSGGWVFSGLGFQIIDYGLPDRSRAGFDVIDDYIPRAFRKVIESRGRSKLRQVVA